MSVRTGPDGRFIIDCYPHGRAGKRIRLKLSTAITNIEDAKAMEQDLLHPSGTAAIPAPQGSTVRDLFPSFLQHAQLHWAETTWRNITWTWSRQFEHRLGPFPVADIDKGHTVVYQQLRKADGVKGRTVNKEMAYFMMFLNWCRTQGHPIKQFRYDKLPEPRPPVITLTFQEAMALILNAPLLYRVFLLTLYSLGIRFAEATALAWEDLDPGNKLIIIRHGKGSKSRTLPVSQWLLHALNAIRPRPAQGLIFRSRITGGPLVNVRTAIAAAAKSAGITKHVNPHLLRHTLATHFMGMNINIKIIQRWLGHAQESTTAELYTHDELAHLRTAQDALDTQLSRHLTKTALTTDNTGVCSRK